jgi:hypothetical protein
MCCPDIVAVSPSSVYRVFHDAGTIKAQNRKPSPNGKGMSTTSPFPFVKFV